MLLDCLTIHSPLHGSSFECNKQSLPLDLVLSPPKYSLGIRDPVMGHRTCNSYGNETIIKAQLGITIYAALKTIHGK